MPTIPRPGETSPSSRPEEGEQPLPLITDFNCELDRGYSRAVLPPGSAVRTPEIHKTMYHQASSPGESVESNNFIEVVPLVFQNEEAREQSKVVNEGFNATTYNADATERLFKPAGQLRILRSDILPEGPVVVVASLLARPEEYGDQKIADVLNWLPRVVLVTDEGVDTEGIRHPINLAEMVEIHEDAPTEIPFTITPPDEDDQFQDRLNTILWQPDPEGVARPKAGRIVIGKRALDEEGRVDYPSISATVECFDEDDLLAGLIVRTSGRLRRTRVQRPEAQAQEEDRVLRLINFNSEIA